MESSSRSAACINRFVLVGAGLVFTMIGLRYILDPAQAAAETGVSLGSALAATTTRVGSGAFPLGFALFLFACLASKRTLLPGVSLVATVVTLAIVVRVIGTVADGPAAESLRLFIPEGVMLALASAGIFLEVRGRRAAFRASEVRGFEAAGKTRSA